MESANEKANVKAHGKENEKAHGKVRGKANEKAREKANGKDSQMVQTKAARKRLAPIRKLDNTAKHLLHGATCVFGNTCLPQHFQY